MYDIVTVDGTDYYKCPEFLLAVKPVFDSRFDEKSSDYDTSEVKRKVQGFHPDAFLLSVEEAESLPEEIGATGSWWCLRSPGTYVTYAADVHNDGHVNPYGDYVNNTYARAPSLAAECAGAMSMEAVSEQMAIDWHTAYAGDAEAAFDAWVEANQSAYREIALKACQIARYHGKVGSKWLGEYARWELPITRTDLNFKFNNNWTPYLSRRLERDYPDLLKGRFEHRNAKADRK